MSFAVINVDMAPRNGYGIVGRISVEMNSNHFDIPWLRQTDMESESLYQPTSSRWFELNIKINPRSTDKPYFWAVQVIDASFNRLKSHDLFVCLFDPTQIGLQSKICA